MGVYKYKIIYEFKKSGGEQGRIKYRGSGSGLCWKEFSEDVGR
jgi:hypothetical protein